MRRLPELRQTTRRDWFASPPGRQLLASEADAAQAALAQRPGQPWLWLAPQAAVGTLPERGLYLVPGADDWSGPIRCRWPLPLANESVATVLVQHVAGPAQGGVLLDECARLLVPNGQLWIFALNPLAPYRWRWQGSGLQASEPMIWRRRLRQAGLVADPVSQGLGPRWRVEPSPDLQHGPGLRAAYLLRAEKRRIPLTPIRQRQPLRIGSGVPAA